MHWRESDQEPRDRNNVMNMINDYKKMLVNKRWTDMHGFLVENEQHGAKSHLYEADNKTMLKNFVTTYHIGRKYQVIELDDDLIGQIKPKIEVGENWTERIGCGCRYYLSVLLVDATFCIVDWFSLRR